MSFQHANTTLLSLSLASCCDPCTVVSFADAVSCVPMKPILSFVCTDNKQEGSPRGEGNQIEEAEDQGYNPLVPGRVVYIFRYKELKHVHQVETRVVYMYRYNKLKHVHQIDTRVVYIYRYNKLKHVPQIEPG